MFTTLLLCFLGFSLAETKSSDSPNPDSAQHQTLSNSQVSIAGKVIRYVVETNRQTLTLGDQEGEIFYTSYTGENSKVKSSKKQRPIAFVFNGGPGSSSVWLHLGVLGPKRIKLADDKHVSGPVYN